MRHAALLLAACGAVACAAEPPSPLGPPATIDLGRERSLDAPDRVLLVDVNGDRHADAVVAYAEAHAVLVVLAR